MRPKSIITPGNLCLVDGCAHTVKARGLCRRHHWKWWKYGDPLFVPVRTASLETRFWHYVDKSNPDGCWPWLSTRTDKGYGQIRAGGKPRRYLLAHRLSYEMVRGPIPEGMVICHRCDNPPCVNPAHLFLGTHSDNMQDMLAKGRGLKGVPSHPNSVRRGESNGSAKLTAEEVGVIRERYASGGVAYASLGEAYGVTAGMIWRIVRRKAWRHVA